MLYLFINVEILNTGEECMHWLDGKNKKMQQNLSYNELQVLTLECDCYVFEYIYCDFFWTY